MAASSVETAEDGAGRLPEAYSHA